MGIIYSRFVLRPSRTALAFSMGALAIAALIGYVFQPNNKQTDAERELRALHRGLSRKNTNISG